MDRRGFLHCLMAVTATLASGVKLPTSKTVASATRKALNTQYSLMSIINECVAVSISSSMADDADRLVYEVEYLHAPGIKGKDPNSRMIDEFTSGLRPINVAFNAKAGELTRVKVEWA